MATESLSTQRQQMSRFCFTWQLCYSQVGTQLGVGKVNPASRMVLSTDLMQPDCKIRGKSRVLLTLVSRSLLVVPPPQPANLLNSSKDSSPKKRLNSRVKSIFRCEVRARDIGLLGLCPLLSKAGSPGLHGVRDIALLGAFGVVQVY